MDSSINAGNVVDEVVALLYCRKDDAMKAITSCARYFSVQVPEKAGDGLCELDIENVLDQASDIGADGSRPILVRGGTDRASTNTAQQNVMKGNPTAVLGMVLCPKVRASMCRCLGKPSF